MPSWHRWVFCVNQDGVQDGPRNNTHMKETNDLVMFSHNRGCNTCIGVFYKATPNRQTTKPGAGRFIVFKRRPVQHELGTGKLQATLSAATRPRVGGVDAAAEILQAEKLAQLQARLYTVHVGRPHRRAPSTTPSGSLHRLQIVNTNSCAPNTTFT